MIKHIGDGIIQTYTDDEKNIQRILSIDKISGKVRIKDYTLNTNELIRDIKCTVFDLDSRLNLEKIIEEICS